MKRKPEKETPKYNFQTYDQEVLWYILQEVRQQRQILSKIHSMVNNIGYIIIAAAILTVIGVVLQLYGGL